MVSHATTGQKTGLTGKIYLIACAENVYFETYTA